MTFKEGSDVKLERASVPSQVSPAMAAGHLGNRGGDVGVARVDRAAEQRAFGECLDELVLRAHRREAVLVYVVQRHALGHRPRIFGEVPCLPSPSDLNFRDVR